MRKITAILLLLALLLSLAACAPDNNVDLPGETPVGDEDVTVTPSKPPVADPAEVYAAADSDSAAIYEATGVYFFAADTVENINYRIIGEEELDDVIAEMSFTVKDNNDKNVDVAYRVQKSELIDAQKADVLFGTKELEITGLMNISNIIATLSYDEGGEAVVSWHDADAGINCCAYLSSSEDAETLFLYANLLYAFVHYEANP